jgi:hypothetical protein
MPLRADTTTPPRVADPATSTVGGEQVGSAMPAAVSVSPPAPTMSAAPPTVGTPDGPGAGQTPVTWLPVAEAAERTSVSESALRKWIKAGELLTRDAPGPRGLRTEVTVEAVVARARQAGIDATPRAGLDLADAFTRLENLTGQLIAMADRAARAEVERDHLKRRLDEVKAEQASVLAGERRRGEAERMRGDAALGELSATREALTAERARADAMLAAVPRRKRHLFERAASGLPDDRTVTPRPVAASTP